MAINLYNFQKGAKLNECSFGFDMVLSMNKISDIGHLEELLTAHLKIFKEKQIKEVHLHVTNVEKCFI